LPQNKIKGNVSGG